MAIYISPHVRDAMISGRIGAVQCGQIAEVVNRFSGDKTMTVDAEVVFVDNVSYNELKSASSGVDSRRQGFYSDGSPKIWIATSWKNGCNGKNGPKVFTGRTGSLTEWVSIRTYLN